LRIPVNVRATVGLGGGVIEGAEPPGGGARPSQSIFGPVVGGALGYERGWFRAELRYDQLIRFGPKDIRAGSVGIGVAY
jgi:hypothetical protein